MHMTLNVRRRDRPMRTAAASLFPSLDSATEHPDELLSGVDDVTEEILRSVSG